MLDHDAVAEGRRLIRGGPFLINKQRDLVGEFDEAGIRRGRIRPFAMRSPIAATARLAASPSVSQVSGISATLVADPGADDPARVCTLVSDATRASSCLSILKILG